MKLPKPVFELEFAHGSIYGEEEKAAVLDVLNANAPSCGPKVREFEEAFAKWCGTRHAISTTNGTSALHTAVAALGIGTARLAAGGGKLLIG